MRLNQFFMIQYALLLLLLLCAEKYIIKLRLNTNYMPLIHIIILGRHFFVKYLDEEFDLPRFSSAGSGPQPHVLGMGDRRGPHYELGVQSAEDQMLSSQAKPFCANHCGQSLFQIPQDWTPGKNRFAREYFNIFYP